MMGIEFNSMVWSLDSLLRAAWLAGTLPILLAFLPSPRLSFFHDTLLGFAKRGKILPTSSSVLILNFFVGYGIVFLLATSHDFSLKNVKLLNWTYFPNLLIKDQQNRPYVNKNDQSCAYLFYFYSVTGCVVMGRWQLPRGGCPLWKDIINERSWRLTVPQGFFLHFYVLAAVWTTLLLLCTWFYAYMSMNFLASEPFQLSTVARYLMGEFHVFSAHKTQTVTMGQNQNVWRVVFMYLLMEVHVLRRLFETLFVFNYSSTARMHIFGYLTGLFFYIVAPLTLGSSCALEAVIYTAHQVPVFLVKGQGPQLGYKLDWCEILTPLLKLKLLQWIGAIIFLWGWIHQLKCHMILGSIREHNELSNDYAIPHGDWFELVSSPHYFAEIVIYTGLLIASGGTDLTIWLLLIFVAANLTLAAVETNKWYHNKFDNYPRSRRAIIPHLY